MTTHGEYVLMRDGQILILRNGEETPVHEELTLSDGTRVMPNGQILMSDGTARMLREGETLTISRQSTDAEGLTDNQFKEAMEDEELRDQRHKTGDNHL